MNFPHKSTVLVVMAWTVLIAIPGWAQANAQFTASRTSGIAPLVVYFDGLQSSGGNADRIHDLAYGWNFGDSNSGTWTISGESKNQASSPWAAHVFDREGTYQVSLTVTAPDGSKNTTQRTINVSNPDAFYAGSKTVCFSGAGSFSGCPSGATRITSSNFSSLGSHIGAGKRLLLRRGETFNAGGTVSIGSSGPSTIGAFGSGANPIVRSSFAESVLRFDSGSSVVSDWRIMDLQFRGPTSQFSSVAQSNSSLKDVLFFRLDVEGYEAAIVMGEQVLRYFGHRNMHDVVSVVDSSFLNVAGNNVYIGSNRLVFMGNSLLNNGTYGHVARFVHVGGGVISHNLLSKAGQDAHLLKVHALDQNESWPFPERESKHFTISHNTFEGGNHPWSVGIGPQNGITNEHVNDAIIEKNFFKSGSVTQVQLLLWGPRVSIRSNVFAMNGGQDHAAVMIDRRGIEPAPNGVSANNNTCYTSDGGSDVRCVTFSNASASEAINNLTYAPNARSVGQPSGSGNFRNNVRVTSNPFVSGSPKVAADFRLKSSSAVDAGTGIAWQGTDLGGNARPAGNNWDLGAFEFGSTAGGNNGGGGSGGGGVQTPPAAPVLLP